MDASDGKEHFQSFCIKYCKVSTRPSSYKEECDVAMAVGLLKKHMKAGFRDALQAAGPRPLLYSCQADGTPKKVQFEFLVDGSGQASQAEQRSGITCVELYMQRAFLGTFSATGKPVIAALCGDPIPMLKGKDHWHCLQAAIEFSPSCRSSVTRASLSATAPSIVPSSGHWAGT